MKESLEKMTELAIEQSMIGDLKLAVATQLELLAIHYKEVRKMYARNLIPHNVVKPHILKEDLKLLKGKLRKINAQLAIHANDTLQYYQIPIAKCQVIDDEIIILVKIPVITENAKFEMYEPIAVPFKYENEICEIKVQKSLLIHNVERDKIKILTGYTLQKCNEKVCSIANTVTDKNALCIKYLFQEKPISEINKICNFECHKASYDTEENVEVPIIQIINYGEYIITNPHENTFIVSENNTKTKLNINSKQPGAFLLKLQCNLKLIQKTKSNEITLINNIIPCLEEIKGSNSTIERLIPAQWSELPDGIFENSLNPKSKFKAEKLKINENWKREAPTTNIQTQLEFEEKLEKIILEKTAKTIYGNPFYQDIANLSLFTINVIMLIMLTYLTYTILKMRSKIFRIEGRVEGMNRTSRLRRK